MRLLLSVFAALIACCSSAQFSTHSVELAAHASDTLLKHPAPHPEYEKTTCTLDKMVFGWHPYWSNGLEANYQWNLISDLCYFSYDVDPNTGNATSTHSWSTAAVIDTAQAHGVNVHLCVTLFSSHATFFGSTTSQNTLINNLITLLQNRGGVGINIDFEGVPSSQSANLTTFMTNLGTALHTANPNYKLSICLYAVDWSNVFDEPTLNNQVDFYTIMGYDYYYSGSSTTGPNDPLYGFTSGYDYSLSRSVSYYLNQGISQSKLVLGLPYYGREWGTADNIIPSTTTGSGNYSRTYKFVKDNASGNYINPVQETRSIAKVYDFNSSGSWHQCWISEGNELRERYELVRRRGLKGIGIWTLGYDDGYSDLWNAISEKLTTCFQWQCADSVYDEGGPEGDYYNNETFQYTINPPGATSLDVNFESFATEANYDTLWLYDGNGTTNLIGAFHGSNSPGSFTTTTGALTVKFKSDNATRAAGWKMLYQCHIDDVPPITLASTNNWITQDTIVSFSDTDVNGVDKTFWNAASMQANGDWKSTLSQHHVRENFEEMNLWTSFTGTWSINSGTVVQSDESQANTNLSLAVTSPNEFLIEWEGNISGTGTSRRGGFHYMCDDLSLTNRGNSYFIWFRVDSDVIQLYEVTNDVFSVVASWSYTIDPGTTYNAKIIYNQSNGLHTIWINNNYLGDWIDATPLTVSQGISLRSGNATLTTDFVQVYESRGSTANLIIGNGGHFETQNPSPAEPAGSLLSLATDASHNIGTSSSLHNVDYTTPELSIPTEENTDIDTLFVTNQLTIANLSANDPNSGITLFQVHIVDAANNEILGWTDVNTSTLFETLNSLQIGMTYLTEVRAINGAGLSDTTASDGFIYINDLSIENLEDVTFNLFPNPATDHFCIETSSAASILVYDLNGRILLQSEVQSGLSVIDCTNWQSGTYFVTVGKTMRKIIIQ